MRIGLQTWGTDGDFYPFLALAIGLRDAGHEVTLAYTSVDGKDYSNNPSTVGIELLKADGDIPISENINPYALASKPGSFKEYSRLLDVYYEPFTEAMYSVSEKLCKENELVIGHAICHTLLTAGQKFSCPRVSLVLTPLVVRSNYVSPIGVQLGKTINSFLWMIGGKLSTRTWFKTANKIRKREGLSVIKSLQKELFTSELLTIIAASQALVSRPVDWKNTVQMTGFLNLPATNSDWKMPDALRTFLDAGEPPVYMTFGSCMQFDLKASTELLIDTARLSGKRAIIQSDWCKLTKPNDSNIYCLENAPHSKVFPCCALIVHHGGAGTTQAALLTGKPSVVVAHGFDQPYWGRQLEVMKVAPSLLLRKNLAPKQLAHAIEVGANSSEMKEQATLLGAAMKQEDGVGRAVSAITELL
jgi:UDP:flavonoid glycosyltransferase YjiC (YdhE family)